MHFILKLVIFVVATCLFPNCALSQMQSGKYKYIHVTSVESCEDSLEKDVWHFSFLFTKNENDEYVLYFNITMLKGLEPDMKIVMNAQRWFPGAGWKIFYPLEETDICENACEHFPEFMSGVFEAMGLTADKENLANTCPIPAGKYKYAEITSFEPCEDSSEKDIWPFSYTFTKNENDEFVIYFNITLLDEIGENTGINLNAQRWFTGSGWKTYYPFDDTNVCENAFIQFPEFMYDMRESIGLPIDKENIENNCPIPAGSYISTPLNVKYHFSKFPELPYGESRMICEITSGEERKLCLIFVGNVIPEGNGNPFG